MKRRHANVAVYKDDMIYCHGTARRAVARAALHLGIDSMTAESIDVVASCLLEYLERIGAMMANNAEAAGRSSAHCNIYDAINAIELCTCTSAATSRSSDTMNGTSHFDATQNVDTGYSNGIDSIGKINFNNGTSWKDLASFCFGANWNNNPPPMNGGELDVYNHHQLNGGINSSNGGKAGPSSMIAMNGSSSSMTNGMGINPAIEIGWNAPYPDEIEHFPVVSKQRGRIANPHPFPEPRLHRRDMDVLDSSIVPDTNLVEGISNVLMTLPDSVFQTHCGWGDINESTQTQTANAGEKRSLEPLNDDESKPPPAKKVRLLDSSSSLTMNQEHSDPISEALLLPTFYPPIPTSQKEDNHIIVVNGNITTDTKFSSKVAATRKRPGAGREPNGEWDHNNPTRLLVRSALVGRTFGNRSSLSSSSEYTSMFWGSTSAVTTNRPIDLVVPAGRPQSLATGADGSSTSGATATTTAATTTPSIVPISRASGSRVSRILEGSMDPPIL